VFVITGASDGIGAEMVRQLARKHGGEAALVLAARNQQRLEAVAQECRTLGANADVVMTDVAQEAQCRALIDKAMQLHGRIDVLVNNAGMSAHALFSDVRAQDLHWYEDLMRVNFWGAVWCTHAALPHVKQSRGSIVAVSSLAGLLGVPGRNAYSATKFAMAGFFEALRAELKPSGVSVTVAYPGVVATETRRRGYNAKGEAAGKSGLKEEDAMPVDVCAKLIVDGMERRDREVVMTARGKLGRFLKLLAPGLVEDMALRALSAEVKPH
jgi:short-subunit dehydrogenase